MKYIIERRPACVRPTLASDVKGADGFTVEPFFILYAGRPSSLGKESWIFFLLFFPFRGLACAGLTAKPVGAIKATLLGYCCCYIDADVRKSFSPLPCAQPDQRPNAQSRKQTELLLTSSAFFFFFFNSFHFQPSSSRRVYPLSLISLAAPSAIDFEVDKVSSSFRTLYLSICELQSARAFVQPWNSCICITSYVGGQKVATSNDTGPVSSHTIFSATAPVHVVGYAPWPTGDY